MRFRKLMANEELKNKLIIFLSKFCKLYCQAEIIEFMQDIIGYNNFLSYRRNYKITILECKFNPVYYRDFFLKETIK